MNQDLNHEQQEKVISATHCSIRPVIELNNVSKHFTYWENRPDSIKRILAELVKGTIITGHKHRIEVLNNVSFHVNPGEFVGIMGRNGAGKSTILKVISGIYQPNGGEVFIRGRIAPLLELGAGFSYELSGRENIYLNSAILGFGKKKAEELCQTIIDFSELGDMIFMPVKNYSSGMVIRLGFSVAVHLDAPILLFDEILSVGDIGFQAKCLKKIDQLHSEGRAIVLVSHSPDQVRKYCSRVIVIENKRVIFDGDPIEGTGIYEKQF